MIFRRSKAGSIAGDGVVTGPVVDSELPINPAILAEIARSRDESFTGAIQVVRPDGQIVGELFIFEGRIYAAEINGFRPDVPTRLVSSGLLTHEAAIEIQQSPHEVQSLSEEIAHSGFVSVDLLAAVHQEFVLASVGALLLVPEVQVTRIPGRITSHVCTLPLGLNQIIQSVGIRYRRMAQDAAEIAQSLTPENSRLACDHPGSIVLGPLDDLSQTHATFLELSIPEIRTTMDQVDGVNNLDSIAGHCGFTRAEVVHIARSLVAEGLTTVLTCEDVVEGEVPSAAERHLCVPEECSSRDWSLASIAVAPSQREVLPGGSGSVSSVTFSPSHDNELIILDGSEGETQISLRSL